MPRPINGDELLAMDIKYSSQKKVWPKTTADRNFAKKKKNSLI